MSARPRQVHAWKQQRGRWSEDLAVRHLQSKNFIILARNIRLFQTEVDILALGPGSSMVAEVGSSRDLCLIEVKSVKYDLAFHNAVSVKQRQRLQNVLQFLSVSSPLMVRAHLVVVQNGQPEIFEDFLAHF